MASKHVNDHFIYFQGNLVNYTENVLQPSFSVTGVRPAPYSLQRNKSDGQLLRSQQRSSDQTSILQYQHDLPSTEDADEQGYVSDVCDYNIERPLKDPGVIHGKLSLTLAPEAKTRVLQVGDRPLLEQTQLCFQADDSYVRKSEENPTVVSPSTRPLSLSLTSSLNDRRTEIIQRRASVFGTPPPPDTLTHADLSRATPNPAYVPKPHPHPPPISPETPGKKASLLQTLAVSAESEERVVTPLSPPSQARLQQQQGLVPPFPSRNSERRDDASDSQLSRQSSVDEGPGMDSKAKRKVSGGKASAIKNKIQMRKMIKEANKLEIPSGVLSDPDNEVDNDSVEEKQDSEPIHDSERSVNNKKLTRLTSPGDQPQSMAQLTPETARRMKDWNSRFSNLKQSFDPGSDKEEDPSRSPSMQRQTVGESSDGDDVRGRGRFKDKGVGQRSKSAHGGVRNNVGPAVVVEEYMQTKDDKNKNNTMIAKRASSHPDKDKSPSVRKLDQETDDEYTQYLCSVDRYRQNNPNPKPFRPITTRSDAIAAPLRKLSDQSGDDKWPFECFSVNVDGGSLVRRILVQEVG